MKTTNARRVPMVVALFLLLAGLASAQPRPPQWPQDFTYLGSTTVPQAPAPLTVNGDSPFGRGLAVRVEADGTYAYLGSWNPQVILKWRIPRDPVTGAFSGSAVFTKNLGRIPIYGSLFGLYIDLPTNTFWASSESEYDADPVINDTLGRATLDPTTGTLVPGGRFSFAGRSDKMTKGGVTALPAWLQKILGCGPLAVGFGAYESVIATGPASMGPALACFDPPAVSAASGAIPNKALLGYPFSSSTVIQTPAAERDTNYNQRYGWGWWPATVSAAPGWWNPGDMIWQGCAYVDTSAVSGLVCAPFLEGGCNWYGSNAIPPTLPVCSAVPGKAASLNAQWATHWIYTYDWRDLASVATGQKPQNGIQAWQRAELQLPGVTYPLAGLPSTPRMVTGVYYEPTQHLFAIMVRNTSVAGGRPTIFWYQVRSTQPYTLTATVTVEAESAAAALAMASAQPAKWVVQGVEPAPEPAPGPSADIPCPAGAVVVAAGAGTLQAAVAAYGPGTPFCLVGTYPITGAITPKTGDTFTCQFGAIIDGAGWVTTDFNQGAFRAHNQDIDDVTVRNCIIQHMPQRGVHFLGGTDRWTVEHNDVWATKTGVNIGSGRGAVVRYNRIHDNPGGGYLSFLAVAPTITGNEIYANGTEQKIVASTDAVFSKNNVHDNVGDGIWFDTENVNYRIDGNTVDDSKRFGIHSEINGPGAITNNAIHRSGDTGIMVVDSKGTTITGNTLADNFRAIQYYLKCAQIGLGALPGGYDLTGNMASGNTITITTAARSGSWANTLGWPSADLACTPDVVAPYLANATKTNVFSGNAYTVPNTTTKWWMWGQGVFKSWAEWQAIGNDTAGTLKP